MARLYEDMYTRTNCGCSTPIRPTTLTSINLYTKATEVATTTTDTLCSGVVSNQLIALTSPLQPSPLLVASVFSCSFCCWWMVFISSGCEMDLFHQPDQQLWRGSCTNFLYTSRRDVSLRNFNVVRTFYIEEVRGM